MIVNQPTNYLGQVSAGDINTANAAKEILLDGGNAFDAIIAAFYTACVSEPILSTLAGGGYMMANVKGQNHPMVYDFFCQSPIKKRPTQEIDFFSAVLDFGVAQQEFHIGRGSIATPAVVAGMDAIQQNLATMPIKRLLEPAIKLAKKGFIVNEFQEYSFSLVYPIFKLDKLTCQNYQTSVVKNNLVKTGDLLIQSDLAETIEAIAYEGKDWFYQGEIAQKIVKMCKEDGGHLSEKDLKNYQVEIRKALKISYRDSEVYLNPAPSMGGTLIAFALKLLEGIDFKTVSWHSLDHIKLLTEVMNQTNQAKVERLFKTDNFESESLLDQCLIESYRKKILNRSQFSRGTTHISVQDLKGNQASMSISNGEGCGYILPKTGIMMNNILGEEDINPKGFHNWNENERMSSMMCPSVIKTNNKSIALGTGGSNRIRTAILQVIHNLIDFNHNLEQAINSPRIHLEDGLLSIENTNIYQHKNKLLKEIFNLHPNHKNWQNPNMFFGGVHAVSSSNDSTDEITENNTHGVGDMRRNGVSLKVKQ